MTVVASAVSKTCSVGRAFTRLPALIFAALLISTAAANAETPATTNITTAADQPETRVDARFQRRYDDNGAPGKLFGGLATVGDASNDAPIPEGVWLAGRVKQLDLDGWRAIVGAAGFTLLEHYYRPPGRPQAEQPWLATVWRKV